MRRKAASAPLGDGINLHPIAFRQCMAPGAVGWKVHPMRAWPLAGTAGTDAYETGGVHAVSIRFRTSAMVGMHGTDPAEPVLRRPRPAYDVTPKVLGAFHYSHILV